MKKFISPYGHITLVTQQLIRMQEETIENGSGAEGKDRKTAIEKDGTVPSII